VGNAKETFGFTVILRWTTFLIISGLIGTFSWLLFSGFGKDDLHKDILGTAAIMVECLKILALVSANTFLFLSTVIKQKYIRLYLDGYFKKSRMKQIVNDRLFLEVVNYHVYTRKMLISFLFYVVCAFVTMTGSFGFVLESIDQGTSLVAVAEVNTQDQIDGVKDIIASRKAQVSSNNDTIQNNKTAIQEDKQAVKSLDPLSETYIKDRSKLERIIKSLLNDNTNLTDANTAFLAQNTTDLNSVSNTAKVAKVEKKAEAKNMYVLMEEATKIPASLIRFVMLNLLSLILEFGLFFTSPHLYSSLDEDKKEEALVTPPLDPTKKKNGRGRPRGSKNKPKTLAPVPPVETLGSLDQTASADTQNTAQVVEEATVDSTSGSTVVNSTNSQDLREVNSPSRSPKSV
jgi:hypothetical protein